MPHSQPSPRVPYRATSTPPRSPLNLPAVPSYRPPQREYPESPTAGLDRNRELHIKPPQFSLSQTPTPRKRYLPKYVRSPKRALVYLLLLGLLGFTARTAYHHARNDKLLNWSKRGEGILGAGEIEDEYEDDGLCRFVSPVEAYQRDLHRLRSLFPESHTLSSHTHTHSHTHNHSHSHHTYSPTGHLIVSSEEGAPHPIPQLLSLGEKRWEELLSRQSRTLEEAVKEYTRRYGRKPPKGFDKWWEFAMEHNLVLPDEYDRINLDLAPFFALPKEEMKRRMELVENMEKTFTLVIEDGEVEIEIRDPGGLKWGGTLPRAHETSNLLKGFIKYLPNMKATFSIFDQPQIYLSWARRGSLIDLGLRGEVTTLLQETDDSEVKLSRSCAPKTNFRKDRGYSEGKSFIYDSLEAGDPCQNPYLIPLHGLTLEPHGHDSLPKPHTQLLPLFSLAKTSINSDILVTPLDQFHDNPGKDPVWEEKDSSKLVWRGSPTGISMMNRTLPWRQSHRIRLHHFAANTSNDPMAFMIPDLGQSLPGGEDDQLGDDHRTGKTQYHASSGSSSSSSTKSKGGEERSMTDPLTSLEDEYSTEEVMQFYYDMKLSGRPIQCSEEDGTCEDMRQEIQWAGHQGAEELNRHKFLLDIDGNGWSGRFRRLMSTNSMVIKMTMFTEWFQPHLIPWFMYVPAKLDFSDLTDIMAFFRGTPKYPELGFDETAAALARNGQCFVQRMFRMEDLQAYMMRLFLEYARIAADEGVDMDFTMSDMVTDEEQEGVPSDWSEPDQVELELEDQLQV
ncbi:hypothetical protein I302_106858 [Kwoniella bestiolae CBS 10118]|uniref:Glycosyl transferase CAP10 domain-containing protein n=1 Tax=Kwoniella bestiolae CBS 10118 TaxID=1296100 RepID=A0A1B9G075_9TREE|nr:hypothetical protein I302_05877 [Kwoniella bestiolae CBS 10118]OCF24417.1 hypothetical protein I302_05877 [Kwoniella bestiolae CBS 10118]